MTGVEILAMEEVVTATAFNWGMFGIVGGAILGVALLIGLLACCCSGWGFDGELFTWFCVLGVVFGAIFGVVAGTSNETPVKTETRYKVVISDEVSMNEFLERYEIVDQEGKIYTIKERE